MKTEKRKAEVGDYILVVKNERNYYSAFFDKYYKVVGKCMMVDYSNLYNDGSVGCHYNHDNYIFSMNEYQVVENLGVSPTHNINEAIEELKLALQLDPYNPEKDKCIEESLLLLNKTILLIDEER